MVDGVKDVIENVTTVCSLPDMSQFVNENSIRSLTQDDDGRVSGVRKSLFPNMDHVRPQAQRMRDRISPSFQSQAIGKIDRAVRHGFFKDLSRQILLRVGQESLRIARTRPDEFIDITRGNPSDFF